MRGCVSEGRLATSSPADSIPPPVARPLLWSPSASRRPLLRPRLRLSANMGDHPDMPIVKCAIDEGGPERLEVHWTDPENISVRLDGEEIHTIPTLGDLQHGVSVTLPDASVIRLTLVAGGTGFKLRAIRDARKAPGASSYRPALMKLAAYAMYAYSGL